VCVRGDSVVVSVGREKNTNTTNGTIGGSGSGGGGGGGAKIQPTWRVTHTHTTKPDQSKDSPTGPPGVRVNRIESYTFLGPCVQAHTTRDFGVKMHKTPIKHPQKRATNLTDCTQAHHETKSVYNFVCCTPRVGENRD